MSYFTEILTATTPAAQPVPGSNILGATGLSRARLAELFRQQGLFGRESDLSPAEQALVQSRFGHIPGLRPRPASTLMTPRLRALAAYTDARIAQRALRAGEQALVEAGYSFAAISEVGRVIENVRTVFGLVGVPRSVEDLVIEPDYAHAA